MQEKLKNRMIKTSQTSQGDDAPASRPEHRGALTVRPATRSCALLPANRNHDGEGAAGMPATPSPCCACWSTAGAG